MASMETMGTSTDQIWKLHVTATRYASFIPHDLTYFHGKFQCNKLADGWIAPPAEILGRSKKLPDFALWMSMAPAVSERAAELITELAGEDVEFLPFHEIKSKRYLIMNVLRCENYLDMDRSDFTQFEERFIFRADIPKAIPPIFKCKNRWSEIFVSSAFGEMLIRNSLRGAALANPEEATMPLILEGESANRFPGLQP